MKHEVQHTHLNPQFGKRRDEPVFIVIKGAKEDCLKCKGKNKKKRANHDLRAGDEPGAA